MKTSNIYMLTPSVYKRLEKLGFLLVCYGCGEALLIGQMVVSCRTRMRVKKLYHRDCWENRESISAHAPAMARNRRLLPVPLGYQPKTGTSSIRLLKTYYKSNPGIICSKKLCLRMNRYCEFHPPELLLQHLSNPDLQLWICQRTADEFLIRVQKA